MYPTLKVSICQLPFRNNNRDARSFIETVKQIQIFKLKSYLFQNKASIKTLSKSKMSVCGG